MKTTTRGRREREEDRQEVEPKEKLDLHDDEEISHNPSWLRLLRDWLEYRRRLEEFASDNGNHVETHNQAHWRGQCGLPPAGGVGLDSLQQGATVWTPSSRGRRSIIVAFLLTLYCPLLQSGELLEASQPRPTVVEGRLQSTARHHGKINK